MKRDRHKKILELIEQEAIGTQEELAARLRSEGYAVTQATVSRDIRELKLSKMAGVDGEQRYISIHQDISRMGDRSSRILKEGFSSMGMAQSVLVVKTVSGMAMAVAAAFDAMQMNEIVGTIAGDDTIMLAIRTIADTQIVMKKIEDILHNAE